MKKVHLLSIGINEYNNFQTLGLCIKDAENMSTAFENRFPDITSDIITDQTISPTSEAIRKKLKEIGELEYSQDDVVILFYAGHGFSSDGNDFITTNDTNLEDLPNAISTDEVITCLKNSKAGNIILIIDACRTLINRNTISFGPRTAELSRRNGIVTYFSCSPGETAKELPLIENGIFTHIFANLLECRETPFTPFLFNKELIDGVRNLCLKHKLGKQTPYTAVAPLEKANYDAFTGNSHGSNSTKKEMVLILGPSNAGKTSIGEFLAKEHEYIHAEMSSFAWARYKDFKSENPQSKLTILDFMEKEIWTPSKEDLIAQDFINSNVDRGKVVLCGARKIEEVETLKNQGWSIKTIFVFANAAERYNRQPVDRYGPDYPEFVSKDLKELSWGIARMPQMRGMELIINEGDITECFDKVVSIINN